MKKTVAAWAVLAVAVLSFAADQPASAPGDFAVQSWYFRWTIARSGPKVFAIEKTNDSLRAVVTGQMDTIWISPKAAHEVGDVLARTDEYAKKLQARKDAAKGKEADLSETVQATDCTVTFRMDPTYGYLISVRTKDKTGLSSVLLTQEDADAFFPAMQKAEAMAAFIDKKIRP